jgi:hypothetical protein
MTQWRPVSRVTPTDCCFLSENRYRRYHGLDYRQAAGAAISRVRYSAGSKKLAVLA